MKIEKIGMSIDKSTSNYLNIPPEMVLFPHWLLWRYVTKAGREKPIKLPVDVSGDAIDATTANMSFTTVCEAMQVHPERYSGIGYSFQESDPFTGYDLDGVLNDTGEITDPEITEDVRRLNSYSEISPSGRGLHVIFKGIRTPDMKPGKRKGCRELYFSEHYFTITGHLWKNSSSDIREIETDLLREIYSKVDPPKPVFIRP